MVLAAIHSWNPFYRVYFISDPNNHENYFGIVAAKEDKGQNATIENKVTVKEFLKSIIV